MNPPEHRVFARSPCRHTLTLTRGEKVLRFSLRPWVVGATVAAVSLTLLASAGSTALFLLSDDVASAFRAREARTVSAYEQRITELRRELDRARSREHSERRTVAEKVETILGRQREIEERYERMEPLLAQARDKGLVPAAVPVPTDRPAENTAPLNAYAPEPAPAATTAFDSFELRAGPGASGWRDGNVRAGFDRALVSKVGADVDKIEEGQLGQITDLALRARERAAAIARILRTSGIESGDALEDGVGGPFVPAPALYADPDGIEELTDALSALGRVREHALALPFAAPVSGARLSSNFGIRTDPFLGRRALHAGVDYAAPTGTPVMAGAAGKVVRAGRRGGYGLLVEIDHGNGHVTRYAHLSAIDVEQHQSVEAGEVIGRVGSTGRSTGPHLHYEVRREGRAIDPAAYLAAGRRLDPLL